MRRLLAAAADAIRQQRGQSLPQRGPGYRESISADAAIVATAKTERTCPVCRQSISGRHDSMSGTQPSMCERMRRNEADLQRGEHPVKQEGLHVNAGHRLQQGIEPFLTSCRRWGAARPDVVAITLVGSWTRLTAKPDSDIDLVLIVDDPAIYGYDDSWLWHFGAPRSIEREDWGLVQSRRVHYADGREVEFGPTGTPWLATDPVEAGTRRVIADGCRVVLDPTGRLEQLVAEVLGQW